MNYQQSITLTNSLEEVERLHLFIDNVCTDNNVDDMDMGMINLAIEELVVNVINYAYPQGTQGDIVVACLSDGHTLTFTIADKGKPFDPTKADDTDITLTAEERPIGGLGIHLVRNIMDTMEYRRQEEQNILTLTKKIV